MPAVFVHGVPETPSIWGPLVAELRLDEAVLLQMPGFGCPLPDGFEPTMHRYATWLADELDAIDEPIDLVVHDWGALLAFGVLGERSHGVRSWVTDAADLGDDFRWHDMAVLWQTPGDGEAMMESFVGASNDDRAALLTGTGVPGDHAPAMASAIDQTMADAILVLYRSAVDIGTEWGPSIDAIDTPALVLDAVADPFRRAGLAARLADRLGAQRSELDGSGHWWMLDDPASAAAAISTFWASL
ncbi:MAG: alpha/beta fold hydrolase [Ilumatobacteraceae bacterium]